MMTEYSLQTIKVEIPSVQKARDQTGKAYYNYEIVATCPAPFKRWKIDRRYGQFLDLYAFFSGTRRIKTEFPRPSILQFSLSKGKLAKLRRKHLEAFLKELLSRPDLRVDEMDKLYHFLDVDQEDENMERDSDFGDVRKELFPDLRFPDAAGDDSEGPTPPRGARGSADGSIDSEDLVKLTSSFNSEFRPTDDLNTDHLSSPARILVSAASFRQEADGKEWHYSVSADGLKEALRNNDKAAVEELLKKSKALATQVDDAGNPMIYTAALYGAIDLGIALIKAGADPQAVNRQGISAMDVAFDPWREAIMRFTEKRDEARCRDACKYEKLMVVLRKNAAGSLGLNIVRTTDNMPVVLGMKPSSGTGPDGSEASATESAPAPDIKPNDIISAVNGVDVEDVSSAVAMIKSSGVEVQLTLIRRVVQLDDS